MTAPPCPTCAGRGYVSGDEDIEPCPQCSGEEVGEDTRDETTAHELNAGSYLGYGNEVP